MMFHVEHYTVLNQPMVTSKMVLLEAILLILTSSHFVSYISIFWH
jgi:hypothetical protein